MVVGGARTTDGRYRVLIFDDQTAQILDVNGLDLTARYPLFEIGRQLDELGVASEELIPD